MSFAERAKKIAPIVRGWRNYHRFTKLDGSRFSLWRLSYAAFRTFLKGKKTGKEEAERLIRVAFPTVGWKENGFINVKGNASPFNGDLVYWVKRNSDKYEGPTAKTLKKQDYACGKCGLKMIGEETVHLHHIDQNHQNWKQQNLMVVHQSCHQELHYAV